MVARAARSKAIDQPRDHRPHRAGPIGRPPGHWPTKQTYCRAPVPTGCWWPLKKIHYFKLFQKIASAPERAALQSAPASVQPSWAHVLRSAKQMYTVLRLILVRRPARSALHICSRACREALRFVRSRPRNARRVQHMAASHTCEHACQVPVCRRAWAHASGRPCARGCSPVRPGSAAPTLAE